MIRIFAMFLLLAMAMQTFQQTFILLSYKLNSDSYAKNCINKNKPQLKCHGKCQMMKKMAEEEKKNEQNPERKLENRNELLFTYSEESSPLTCLADLINNQYAPYISGAIQDYPSRFFHPPALV